MVAEISIWGIYFQAVTRKLSPLEEAANKCYSVRPLLRAGQC